MILFFESGRLGNQLFQYCGLKQYFPEHNFVFFGCEDLQRHFDCSSTRFIPKSALVCWLPFRILRRIVFFLVAIRIFSRITEESDSELFKLTIRKGFFSDICVTQNIYFQHCDFVDQIKMTPRLNANLIQVAHDWLTEKLIDQNSNSLIFVHIRRGDYLNWPSTEFPAVLDLAWYKRSMKFMQEKIKNPVFILMSDDQFYLRDVFKDLDGLIISDNPPEVDMALMSLCHSGILSASSFAWWGAFFARSKLRREGTFLAPQYWCGHRVKKWYPTGFITNWITYQE